MESFVENEHIRHGSHNGAVIWIETFFLEAKLVSKQIKITPTLFRGAIFATDQKAQA